MFLFIFPKYALLSQKKRFLKTQSCFYVYFSKQRNIKYFQMQISASHSLAYLYWNHSGDLKNDKYLKDAPVWQPQLKQNHRPTDCKEVKGN